jgi:hypothetical protein
MRLVRQIYGTYQLVDEHHPSVFAYTRIHGGDSYLIVLNFSREFVEWEVPQAYGRRWVPIKLTSHCESLGQEVTKLRLGPYDGVICQRESCKAANGDRESDTV